MGALSIWHILIVAVIVVLLFGRGKISEMMGDVAKGIRNFRKGLSEPEEEPRRIEEERKAASDDAAKDRAAKH